MGKEIPWETRVAAEELYITDGYTFEQTAETTGVSISQLKRWAADGDWRSKRQEHRAALIAIRRDSVELRKRLIKAALDSLDPQQVYAAARFEQVAAQMAAKYDGMAEVPTAGNLQAIKTPADAAAALTSVVEKKINFMLVKPDEVNLAAVKEIKQALELIEKMRAKYGLEDEDGQARPEGLSDAAAEEIRRRILGITQGV